MKCLGLSFKGAIEKQCTHIMTPSFPPSTRNKSHTQYCWTKHRGRGHRPPGAHSPVGLCTEFGAIKRNSRILSWTTDSHRAPQLHSGSPTLGAIHSWGKEGNEETGQELRHGDPVVRLPAQGSVVRDAGETRLQQRDRGRRGSGCTGLPEPAREVGLLFWSRRLCYSEAHSRTVCDGPLLPAVPSRGSEPVSRM